MEGEVSDFDIRDDRPMPSKMSLGSLDYPFDDLAINSAKASDFSSASV